MALELQFFPGYKDGDEPLSAANTDDYVGGMPLGAFADGLSASKDGDNFMGMALNDRDADATNGKAGYAPRGSKGILKPSLSPTFDKLIISKGVSAGQATLGQSNLGAFAKSLSNYPTAASGENPDTNDPNLDPTLLGATKKFPYEAKTYTAGQLLYVNVTTGKWTNDPGDAGGKAARAQVVSVSGEAISITTF